MGEQITIEVSDKQLVDEIAYGIIGRAQNIHENPHDEFEHHAEELRDIGQSILEE